MRAGTGDDQQLQLFTILHIKKQSVHYRILRSYKDTLHGASVIIGFQKTQIYQRFAGSRQEAFILKCKIVICYVFFYAVFNLRNLLYIIKDYADLWELLSELLKKLPKIVSL